MSTSAEEKVQAGAAGRRKRGDYHHGNLRAALIVAAGRILAEDGVGALSLRAAARAAGVSQTAPYRHFADKEALLAAVATQGFEGLTAGMRGAGDGVEDLAARIQALGMAYVRFATENPQTLRLMFGPECADKGSHPALGVAALAAWSVIREAIGSYVGGEAAQAEVATIAAWANVHGLASLLADRQLPPGVAVGQTDEALAEAVTGLFVAGLNTIRRDRR